MRTLLIGSDFMYDKNGNLKPIEINTAIGWSNNKFETDAASIDLSELTTFVQTQSFTQVYYIGSLKKLPKTPRVIFTGCGVWTKGENLFKTKNMKSIIGILFAGLILASCAGNQDIEVGQKTTMEVNLLYDAGNVIKGEVINAKFKVKNTFKSLSISFFRTILLYTLSVSSRK